MNTVDDCGSDSPVNWLQALNERRSWLSMVVYARVKDSHAVEEVLQETALAATRHGQMNCDHDSISRWLYRVAVRQSLLYRRNRSRQHGRLDRYAAQMNGREDRSRSNEPLGLVLLSEKKHLVHRAMSALRPRDCEILMLKYAEDWSCRELAERLQVSAATIKLRLLRARQCLRKELLRLEKHWDEK